MRSAIGQEYSLWKAEGHGLRELVILLTYVYRPDWQFLVVDEPELHLHPSLARLWLAELQFECRTTDRRALVVTHEPRLLTPKTLDEMQSILVFRPDGTPARLGGDLPESRSREIETSLAENPQLVGDIVFSPRPVLVEGPGDVAAFTQTSAAVLDREAFAQTDLVPCGGKSKMPLWLRVTREVGLDVRCVLDLDAFLHPRSAIS